MLGDEKLSCITLRVLVFKLSYLAFPFLYFWEIVTETMSVCVCKGRGAPFINLMRILK